jgi:hypothetical protein
MKTGSHFANQWGLEVTAAEAADDYLHTELCREVGKHTCAETQFFGFSIPEHQIHGINYIRQHPNMGHMLGGALVFQGVKRQFLASEIADYRLFMTDDALDGDLHSVTLENSYHTEIIEPMARFRTSYLDAPRKNSFDIGCASSAWPISVSSPWICSTRTCRVPTRRDTIWRRVRVSISPARPVGADRNRSSSCARVLRE